MPPAPRRQIITVSWRGRDYRLATLTRKAQDDWLVFVHGWGGCKDCFTEAFDRQEFADFSICAIDLLGFGESDKPRDFSYSLNEQAEILALAITALKPRRVYLVGHSMGGGIGLLAAAMLGDLLAGFVTAEGNVGVPTGSLASKVAALPYWQFASIVLPLVRLLTFCAPSPKTRRIGAWLRQTNARTLHKSAQSLRNYSRDSALLPALAKLPSSVYICGAKSNRLQLVVPHIEGRGIKVAIIPGADHVMMLDNPEGFYQAINESLFDKK